MVKGNQFYFDSEELSLWFNGTTQWVYFKKTREVNISTPTADELAQTNPMMVVSDTCQFNSFDQSGRRSLSYDKMLPKMNKKNLKS